jgi:hypothetical protein
VEDEGGALPVVRVGAGGGQEGGHLIGGGEVHRACGSWGQEHKGGVHVRVVLAAKLIQEWKDPKPDAAKLTGS